MQIQTAEPLVPESSPFDIENDIATLERSTSPSTDQVLAELIQAGSEILRYESHALIHSSYNWE
jgi:hypothetical protein